MHEAHVIAIVVVGVCTFAIGLIPLKLARDTSQPLVLSLTLCFGGGVLLSTSITHMLAESSERLNTTAGLLFCGGFLLLYVIDEIIHVCIGDVHTTQNLSDGSSSRRSSGSSRDCPIRMPTHFQRAVTNYGTLDKLPKRMRVDSVSKSFLDESLTNDVSTAHRSGMGEDIQCCKKHEKEARRGAGCWKTQHDEKLDPDEIDTESESTEWRSDSHSTMDLCHVEIKQKPCPNSNMSLPGLLTALLVHSLLEGCSIGVQTDSYQILLVLAAVACHKLILAFCLGLELANAQLDGLSFVLAISAFSVGCPIGIAIGATVIDSITSFDAVEDSLQAVAGGSLLYVAVFEVLPRERYKWQHRPNAKYAGFFQMISVLFGFAAITLTDILILGTHGHGHNAVLQPPP